MAFLRRCSSIELQFTKQISTQEERISDSAQYPRPEARRSRRPRRLVGRRAAAADPPDRLGSCHQNPHQPTLLTPTRQCSKAPLRCTKLAVDVAWEFEPHWFSKKYIAGLPECARVPRGHGDPGCSPPPRVKQQRHLPTASYCSLPRSPRRPLSLSSCTPCEASVKYAASHARQFEFSRVPLQLDTRGRRGYAGMIIERR